MAPVSVNKPSNSVSRKMDSRSMPVATMTRRRYPRLCKRQFPVVVEEEPEPAPSLEKKSTRSPRKLTERRKDMIRGFMEDYLAKPHKYGNYGTESWIGSLIERMGEKPHYGLVSEDVQNWIKNEQFFKSEMINLLPRCHLARSRLQRQLEQIVPPVQPRPATEGVVSHEGLPNDPQPNNVVMQTVPKELEEQLALMKITSKDTAVSGRPIKMEPEEEPEEDEEDIIPPLPTALPPPHSDASQVVFVCEIEAPLAKLSKIVDGIKRGNHSNINFEELCDSFDMLKGMITLIANNNAVPIPSPL